MVLNLNINLLENISIHVCVRNCLVCKHQAIDVYLTYSLFSLMQLVYMCLNYYAIIICYYCTFELDIIRPYERFTGTGTIKLAKKIN